MKLPVVFVSSNLAVGGSERQWALLIPLLRERGFSPSVLTLLGTGAFYDQLADHGIPVEHAGLRGRTDVLGLAKVVGRRRPERLVVTQSFAAQCVGHAMARRAGVPHVTTEHQPAGLRRRTHEQLLLSRLAPRVPAVVAVTEAQLPDLVDLGYRRERIRVIPPGIPPLEPTPAVEELRRSLGLEGCLVAVMVARLQPQKRADVFVEAVRLAAARDPAWRGVVVGGGPELERIEAAAAPTGGAVTVVGERVDAVDFMAMADVVCLTSEAEGLPGVVLEAMSLGKPVVATDAGGTREAVVHETTGLLVPEPDAADVADALVRLGRDPASRARLGREARNRHAALFTAEAVADRYALLFESMISSSGATAGSA